uniref:Post-GPI attachment to proteins factor 3 n=1 Tax=Phallusia mammillata TaxID=59560 RepID=A0A6F9DMZ9_9ASCI|nr:post-GPI attachment to proteins factor 3 [Phallusia mammillata]
MASTYRIKAKNIPSTCAKSASPSGTTVAVSSRVDHYTHRTYGRRKQLHGASVTEAIWLKCTYVALNYFLIFCLSTLPPIFFKRYSRAFCLFVSLYSSHHARITCIQFHCFICGTVLYLYVSFLTRILYIFENVVRFKILPAKETSLYIARSFGNKVYLRTTGKLTNM